MINIPTEPIGSIPRPAALVAALQAGDEEAISVLQDHAVAETVRRLEEIGCPVVVDGEQAKPSFVTYPMAGLALASDGVVIPFADGHTRQLPRLTAGPFRYGIRAESYLKVAQRHARVPVKQAVIAASALSLLYPQTGLPDYPQQVFLEDLVNEAESDIRGCLDAGAHCVQMDFTEGRLSLKLDPTGSVLDQFLAINTAVLERFSDAERARIGVHTCPGGDHDSTHSADIDYAMLLPKLLALPVGNFYLQLASEPDPARVLGIVRENLRPGVRVFVGVVDPISPLIETAEQVCDRILEAASYIPVDQLGTCDDCGFSPFADDTSTSREIAFGKIAARVRGTAMAAEKLSS